MQLCHCTQPRLLFASSPAPSAAARLSPCRATAARSSSSSGSSTAALRQPQQQQQEPSNSSSSIPRQPHHHQRVAALLTATAALSALHPGAAAALTIHAEPSNALSLPTWAIHVSSVTEWVAAMALFWRYAEVTGNARWKGMTWGMMPALGSAMAACTWHFFYNSPDLDFLVALQAFLTVVGNCTCWFAAWRIYTAAQAEQASG